MRRSYYFTAAALLAAVSLTAQEKESKRKGPGPEDLPTSSLISQPGPSFRQSAAEAGKQPVVITYGDQRFTDPANTKVTNPRARKLLVEKIAAEQPNAVLMNGDVPYSGDVVNDYEVYRSETEVWRKEHLHIYPALGNHEFHGDPQQALEHWWNAFPEMRGRRWYSVELGPSLYTIALDSDTSLAKGSDQMNWLNEQLMHLPKSTLFVFISLHHPPVADFQTRINVSHNPRPNEIALRDDLEALAAQMKAKIVVIAGHIHNYERFSRGDVTYLVSGGGAASPVEVERAPEDLYQDKGFPNYHFVEFVLHDKSLTAKMYRLADANAETPVWEVKDTFEVHAK
jgi:acid phosphatase type 7